MSKQIRPVVFFIQFDYPPRV